MNYQKTADCIANDYEISPFARYLKKHGFTTAAIYYKNLNETIDRKSSRAFRHLFETINIPTYTKGQVVFANPECSLNKMFSADNPVCHVDWLGICKVNQEAFEEIPAENLHEAEIKRLIMKNSINEHSECPFSERWFHGGVHHVEDFKHVLQQGIISYKNTTLEKLQNSELEYEKVQFYEGILDVIAGIETYIARYLETLKAIEDKDAKLERLINALENVPMNPARNFYEAFISMNIVMFLSEWFEPGRIDSYLYPYYENDETTNYDDAYECIRGLYENIERRLNRGATSHIVSGGSKPDGSHDYNILTEISVKAIGGLRAPNLTLRIRKDMPQNIWDAYLDNISKGYAQPSIVNEDIYLKGLVEEYNIPMEDAVDYVFGGCSETMIQGKTFCHSTWLNYNVLDVFENTFLNEFLSCETYEELYSKLLRDIKYTVKEAASYIKLRGHKYAENTPYPIRSLLTDDCVEKGVRFSNGGTKYNFDNSNIFGTTNTVNCLYTLKYFYDGKFGDLTKVQLLDCLSKNYVGYEEVYQLIRDVPKYGNFNEEINEITADLVKRVSDEFKNYTTYRDDGRFMPAVILFNKWEMWGRRSCATLDGRVLGEALADSAAPMQGTDIQGPTSALGSALAMPQDEFVGTCIFNLRLDQKNFRDDESREKVKNLFQAYFAEGGCQLQVNVVDQAQLIDALENPEKHKNIIVRVGGYSDNFIYLSDELKQEIIRRSAL